MPNGTSAPGKSSAELDVPMNGLTTDAGSLTSVAALAVTPVTGRTAAATRAPAPTIRNSDPGKNMSLVLRISTGRGIRYSHQMAPSTSVRAPIAGTDNVVIRQVR